MDEQDRPLPLLETFKQLAKEFHVPEFLYGFKVYADAHKAEVGKPLSDERYFAEDMSVQLAEGGLLVYSKLTNETRFMPAGK